VKGTAPLLTVEELTVGFGGRHGLVRAVDGVSFTLGREKLGIVGESGSGKSMTGRAILKVTPPKACVEAQRLDFAGIDLLKASERQMRAIRGSRIAMILQDPKYSLNPVVTVGEQIAEAYRLHRKAGRGEARRQALSVLEAVQIRDPARVYRLYPHQVSGGMGQRIMIAMMLVARPDLLIADEPTSALDVTVRLEILSLLDELIASRGLGLIFISHDLNLVRNFCDRVLIMYAGRVVEALPAAELEAARHPYTRGLLDSLPRIHSPRRRLPVLQRDPAWRTPVAMTAP
jgi:peptide/nickel transport system ATP-binding protein